MAMMSHPRLSLPTVSAPAELQTSLRRVLDGKASVDARTTVIVLLNFLSRVVVLAHVRKKVVADGRVLYRHLVSRKAVSRVQESRRRRGLLRVVPGSYHSGGR